MDSGRDAGPDSSADAADAVADASPDGPPADGSKPDGTGGDAALDGPALDPVGAPCANAAGCQGEFCITDALGFPGGYCSYVACDVADPEASCSPYGGDGICIEAGQGSLAMCFDQCDPQASDCRAEYVCGTIGPGVAVCLPAPVCGNGTVEVGEECEPPDSATCDADCQGKGAAPVGDPCSGATECAGNYCITEWPDGYCSDYDCDLGSPDTSCAAAGGDALCWNIGEPGSPFGICFDRCNPAMPDCRGGYECITLPGGMGLCAPEPVCGNGVVEQGEECEPPGTATCDAGCQGKGTAPVGEPCASAADCAGNYCIDPWPDGYCSMYGCDLAAPDTSCQSAGGDARCMDVGDSGSPLGVCLDRCEPGQPDCRAGYTCQSLPGGISLCMPSPVCGNGAVEMGEECEPPGTTTCDADCQGFGDSAVGQSCQGADDCAGNLCVGDWPDGYCSQLGCNPANATTSCASAGGDGMCIDVGDSGSPVGICLDRCAPLTPNCRTGYECVRIALTVGLCLPTPVCGNGVVERGEECEPPGTASCGATCQGPGTAPMGVSCTSPSECAGNLCLTEASGWTGGYCSQGDCDPFSASSCDAYGPDAVCGVLDLFGAMRIVCVDGCTSASDCRPGYQCQWVGIGGNGCVPQ